MQMMLQLCPAAVADYPLLASIGHEAFHADKLAYGKGPEIYENPAFLLPILAREDDTLRKLMVGEETIGFVLTYSRTDTSRWVGCLCLLPAWQGKGYGSQALRLVEDAYPQAMQWGLDTPAASEQNVRFYQRAGYQVVTYSEAFPGFTLAVLEKRR